jgi:hypothetical protein
LLHEKKLEEIVAGRQHESKMFTIEENKSILSGTESMVKCLMLGGGDETCQKTRSNATYIIQGMQVSTKINKYI